MKRALCVIHDVDCAPGLVGEALRNRGWSVEELPVVPAGRRKSPNVAVSFPDPAGYDLLVPLGSPSAAYDDAGIGRWLLPELEWLAGSVRAGGAVLAICFGAQALARALGGSVRASGHPELGWVTVDSAAPELVAPGPWFESHSDTFTPPPGAVELARNASAVQAFRVGRSLGVQFHPEVTSSIVKAWLATEGKEEQLRALGLDAGELAAAADDAVARERGLAFVDAYLERIFPA